MKFVGKIINFEYFQRCNWAYHNNSKFKIIFCKIFLASLSSVIFSLPVALFVNIKGKKISEIYIFKKLLLQRFQKTSSNQYISFVLLSEEALQIRKLQAAVQTRPCFKKVFSHKWKIEISLYKTTAFFTTK